MPGFAEKQQGGRGRKTGSEWGLGVHLEEGTQPSNAWVNLMVFSASAHCHSGRDSAVLGTVPSITGYLTETSTLYGVGATKNVPKSCQISLGS